MNNLLLYLVIVLIWGSTWIAISFQLGEVPPVISIIYRFGLASLVLFIFCRIKKINLTFTRKQHFQMALFGLCLFGSNYYFIYHAQQYINSALTCIACSLLLAFNMINARIWFKTPLNSQAYIGGTLGTVGIITMFWLDLNDVSVSKETLIGLGLSVLGTFLASAGNMLSIKNKTLNLPVMAANTWGMFYGTVFMTIIAIATGTSFTFSLSTSYIASLLFLSIFGSVIAFGCYLTLLNNIGAHKASYATIMFPAVAVVISTLVENFTWSEYTFAGFVFIILGNLVMLAKPGQRAKWLTMKNNLTHKTT